MVQTQICSDASRRALSFFQQNPLISRSLLSDCNHDFEQVTTIIEPLLNPTARCSVAAHYIQAIATERTSFLATNLTPAPDLQITDFSSSWLVGRGDRCAINIQDSSVSRCHSVISYCPENGFYLTDVGSSNGTFLNCRRIPTLERLSLRDGDLIQFGNVQVEFFLSIHQSEAIAFSDATFF